MAIITISRGSYSKGRELAEKAAARLGYECISREVLIEASKEFNIPEIKLVRAIHDAPSILDRFAYGKQKYVAFIRAAICRHLQKDNVIYCGLAGHFFVGGVAHALRVRIVADMADRVKAEMEREGISAREAERILKKDDAERRKWSQYLYGIDTREPRNYDMVLHISNLTVDDAVDIVCNTVSLEHFKTTPESQKAMDDLALAAEVKAALVNAKPDVEIEADGGVVKVYTATQGSAEASVIKRLEELALSVPGVKQVKFEIKLREPVD